MGGTMAIAGPALIVGGITSGGYLSYKAVKYTYEYIRPKL